MITNDNIASEIGDVIIFESVPMLNLQTIVDYSDSITGESGIRFFTRDFRYSLDGGITYSDWYNLNGANVSNITNVNTYLASNYHQLVLQFRFTRTGTDNTGQLQINSITVNSTNVERGNVFTISSKGPFKDVIFNNIDVINLMINLAQKMYEQGEVPVYITRKQEETGLQSDEDYIDFWQAVAYFYAAMTIDSIKFENIYWRRPLLCEYLQEKNVFVCDCTNIIELQLIAQSYYTEMRVRGTEEVFKPKGYEYSIGYRNSYVMPTSYVIQPSTPVQVDGIVYREVYTLPFGWTVQGVALVAGDRNYHQVLFFNTSSGAFDLPPQGQSVLFPTDESGILKRYNGEYLRLICFNGDCDEFIYNNVPDIFIGWCLGHCSPLYRGLRPQKNRSLIKAYENQQSVQDLNKYPLINPNQIYIGIDKNPYGVDDSVMYISSDGSPCFANIIPLLTNVSKHLNLNITSSVSNVDGLIKITNLLTLDEFDVPISLSGQPNFSINTDLTPARYSVELIFTFAGKMISEVNDNAALIFDLIDLSGNVDQLYSLTNVGSDTINININFTY